jgi:hypothetical protein
MNKEQILKAFPTFQNVFEGKVYIIYYIENLNIGVEFTDEQTLISYHFDNSLPLLEQAMEKSKEINKEFKN